MTGACSITFIIIFLLTPLGSTEDGAKAVETEGMAATAAMHATTNFLRQTHRVRHAADHVCESFYRLDKLTFLTRSPHLGLLKCAKVLRGRKKKKVSPGAAALVGGVA